MNMKSTILMIVMISSVALLFSCEAPQTPGPQIPSDPDPGPQTVTPDSGTEPTQELKKFSTKQELLEYIKNAGTQSVDSYSGGRGVMMESSMALDGGMMSDETVSAPTSAGEFSETNVQVKGVDEADIVKNDGKYIYTLSGQNIVIVDAFPAEDAEIVFDDEIDGYPQNLFVNGDRMVIFATDSEEFPYIAEYDYMPRPRWTQVTHAYVYDISDRSDPELVQDYTLRGYYTESRMIGDHVYFIVNENVYYHHWLEMPVIRGIDSVLVSPEIYYFDNPEDNYNFNTVASFDINKDDDINAETYLLGYSNTIYVSQDNIYITYQKNYPWYYDTQKDRFFDVIVPLLPSNIKSKIKSIGTDPDKWDEISAILEEMYNDLSSGEREDLVDDIEDAVEEYEIKKEAERRKTVIHKIGIDNGDIDYDTRGEVPGYLLNQFSLDENDGYLRVATTTYIWRGGSDMYNNVFVLDDDLDIVGEIEDIAPDEKIYSTRFIGDRLYMVTFKNIDPFFVIDLSDPKDPEILGKLKIPGYSDYLHPYDEDHIIGIGKETEGNQWGGVSVEGVKLALFDVSDVENPKQLDKYEIGDSGTDSEALRDHKAFLFDKEKNLLVIPVREVRDDRYYDDRVGYYRQDVWQGAYVFSLTPERGFDVQGKITHSEGKERWDYYYSSPSAVRRALYMDDVLYTISATTIKMNELDDIDEEIGEIDLPYEEKDYYSYRYY